MKKLNIIKYSAVIIICLTFTQFSLSGCYHQIESSTSTSPSLIESDVVFNSLSIVRMGDTFFTTGIVKNNSNKLYSFHIELIYYGSGNRIIAVGYGSIDDLYPGMEKVFFEITAEGAEHAKRIEAHVTNIISAEESSITPDFKFENLYVYNHKHGTSVLGEVTNLDDIQYSIIILAVVFNKKGIPVKSNIQGIDNIYPGETRIFSAPILSDESNETDCRVYLETVKPVVPMIDPPNIKFSDLSLDYDSINDSYNFHYNIINNDKYGYRVVDLLYGVYDNEKIIDVMTDPVLNLTPGEIRSVSRNLPEGDWKNKKFIININAFEMDK